MLVFYDNHCPLCVRTALVVRKLDWLRQIELKALRNDLELNNYPDIDKNLALVQMASLTNKWQYGFSSIFEITKRIPLFWMLVPFFGILKISGLGQFLYVHLSIRRKIIPMNCNENCNIK